MRAITGGKAAIARSKMEHPVDVLPICTVTSVLRQTTQASRTSPPHPSGAGQLRKEGAWGFDEEPGVVPQCDIGCMLH